MRWSIKLGRFAGIDVYLHVTFLLFLAFIAGLHAMAGGTLGAVLEGVLFFCAVFGCVLLHEYGHALAARRFGVATRDITLLPIGGVARLERMPDRPLQELWVALAGPAVNVVIAAVLGVWVSLHSGGAFAVDDDLVHVPFSERLMLVNVALVIFNLIPAFPMDGGRVLRALLALRMEYARATQIAATLGQGIALVFAFFGLLGLFRGAGNPLLLFIAFFVWIGASQESAAAQLRSSLGGVRVRDAMLTSYFTLSPGDSLDRAVALVMAGSQPDFPVVLGREVVGVLTRQRLLVALAEQGRGGLVESAMDSDFPTAQAAESLEALLRSSGGPGRGPIPVLERGELVGLLTWDNVTDFLLIQSALHRTRSGTGLPPVLRS